MTFSAIFGESTFVPRYLWRDGALVPWNEANIHVSSIGHSSISSVFEGIKAYWNSESEELYVFRLEEHVERFLDSIRLVRLNNRFDGNEIHDAILRLLRANETSCDVYIRPWVFARGLVREAMVPAHHDTELVIDTWSFTSRMLTARTCRAGITTWTRIGDHNMPPRIKAFSNYHNGRLGVIEAQSRGFDWPIFLNDQHKVTEGPASCIGMIRKGAFITPPLSSGILDSITRSTFLTIIPDALGVPVIERDIERNELYLAEELFYFGTGWEILPIVQVDDLTIGAGVMGDAARRLDRAYHDLVRGLTPRYSEWRTPLYNSETNVIRPAAVWNPKVG